MFCYLSRAMTVERKSSGGGKCWVFFNLLLASGEAHNISMEENKNLLSANPDESLQAVAELPSAFNSLTILFADNAAILRVCCLLWSKHRCLLCLNLKCVDHDCFMLLYIVSTFYIYVKDKHFISDLLWTYMRFGRYKEVLSNFGGRWEMIVA